MIPALIILFLGCWAVAAAIVILSSVMLCFGKFGEGEESSSFHQPSTPRPHEQPSEIEN